ncbi:hypothetical protein [Sorangium cellulosum]|nr:hypothetical protein [Sorangium cellulosum]
MSTATVKASAQRKFDPLAMMLAPPATATRPFVAWAWRYLLAHLAFRYTERLLTSDEIRALPSLCLALMTAALVASFAGVRWARASKAIAAVAVAIEMASRFPFNSNHSFAETLLLILFVLVDFPEAEQRDLLVAMGRWIITLIMFHSGLQKILHGTYFDGMYLATRLDNDRFQWLLRHVLQPEEFTSLHRALQAGSEGPFAFHSPAAIVFSNAVYLSELLVALLLVRERTRALGTALGVMVIAAIEVVAREITFGILALNLLMLFFPLPWRKAVAALSIVAYVALLAAQWYVGPDVFLFV